MKTRRLLVRCATATMATAAVVATSACTGSSGSSQKPPSGVPAADTMAKQVATALTQGDVSKLAMTTSASQAQTELGVLTGGMDGLRPTVTPGQITYQGKDSADVTLQQSLPLGAKTWSFTSHAPLKYADGAWKLAWAPSVVSPDLDGTHRLRHVRDLPKRAAINGSDGQALVEMTTAFRVGVDKANLPKAKWQATAKQVAQLVKIDAAAYTKKVLAAGDKAFVPAITLRNGQVPDGLANHIGIGLVPVDLPLAPSSSFAVGLLGTAGQATPEIIKASKNDVLPDDVVGLSGLQKRYDAQLRGTAGHTIVVVPRNGASASPTPTPTPTPTVIGATASPSATPAGKVLFSEPSSPGTPVKLSLNRDLQEQAEKALASQKGVASLVVVKVGTGDLLAAANSPASQSAPDATVGRYAPGSTFKVVSALALLRKGLTPTSTVPCTATVAVNGRSFKNYSDFPSSKVGNITLTDALANSCNTAFISQNGKLGKDDLAAAAASLGVGTDYDAGYSSFFGSVPAAPDVVTKAADMIGQGTVEASPMAMAGVAASVASGKTVVPWLVEGKKPVPKATLSAAEAKQLQAMMQAVVTSGSGKVLQGQMLGAKTGTAEYGTANPPKTHAWMIAWNKTYAVAAMVEDGESGSKTAAPIIKSFLTNG